MGNTIVSFRDKYYEYGVDPDPDRRGLTIGGFESAFLADFEATYLFDKLNHIFESHTKFIGTYRDDEIVVFRGNQSNEWLSSWLSTFQREVNRLLGTIDIQFTMEVWRPGDVSGPLPDSLVSVEGIGEFHTVSINGDHHFPYLDIKLSWGETNTLTFGVHRKPGELVKYLNTDSHHHRHHKTAVLSGVELRLALLTTRTSTNAEMSLSDIYPDKHDALRLAGQLKHDQKMRTLGAVLDDESDSGPARLEKKSRATDKRDSFLVVKYASLGHSQRPLVQTVKKLRNAFKLKWLRPRVVFSRHTNLQEKLLGDLRRKLLMGIEDADFGPRPCNCPRKFKVDGVCAYGDSKFTCRTAGCVYKITCKVPNCQCFYVGKSQRYTKTRIQEHIGEVTKLYNKHVLLPNSTMPPTAPSQQSKSTRSSTVSLATQSMSGRDCDDLMSQLSIGGLCIPTESEPPHPPDNLTIAGAPSDISDIDPPVATTPPIVNFPTAPRTSANVENQQDKCSALARHLFAHVKNQRFNTKAEVAGWCRSNISVDILWRSTTLSLVKTAGQKSCRLCATERLIIGQNITGSTHRRKKILNLKTEMRGACTCKTRFLRFTRSE